MPTVQEMQGLALQQELGDRGGRLKAHSAGMVNVIMGCMQERLAADC